MVFTVYRRGLCTRAREYTDAVTHGTILDVRDARETLVSAALRLAIDKLQKSGEKNTNDACLLLEQMAQEHE